MSMSTFSHVQYTFLSFQHKFIKRWHINNRNSLYPVKKINKEISKYLHSTFIWLSGFIKNLQRLPFEIKYTGKNEFQNLSFIETLHMIAMQFARLHTPQAPV